MQIAVVVGSVVSTIKESRLTGLKLLLVRAADTEPAEGRTYVAVDLVGAGDGETVLVTRGAPAAAASDAWGQRMPIDAAIVGIVDTVHDADGPATTLGRGPHG